MEREIQRRYNTQTHTNTRERHRVTVKNNEKKRVVKQKWVFWVKTGQNFKNSIYKVFLL